MSKKRYDNFNYYQYEYEFLQNIIYSLFTWKNLPETVDERFLNQSVSTFGYTCGTIYNNEFVVVNGALSGIDRQQKPTVFTCANPVLPSFTRKIDGDCAILYNTNQYLRMSSDKKMLRKYALELANVDTSVLSSLLNSRVSLVFSVQNENEAQRARLLYDDISNGKPAVMWYGLTSDMPQIVPIKARDNIVTSELNDARRNILANFFTELGVKTLAVDKKERTNLLEIDSNSEQLEIIGNVRLDERKRWCEKCNKLFNLNIEPMFNFKGVREVVYGNE